MTRSLPISLAVVSFLSALPQVALAQTTPPPAAPPTTTAPPATTPSATAPSDATALPAPPPQPPSAPVVPSPTQTPMMAPPPPVFAPPPPGGSPIELTSLRLMREKGLISKEEFESAVRDMGDTAGAKVGDTSVVFGKWATTIYGFVDADTMYDSTRSFNDLAGSSIIAAPGTTAGNNGRWTSGIRNSRFGLRLKAPEVGGVRGSGVIETDWLGAQLPIETGPYPGNLSPEPYGSEGTYFTSPTMRIRHAYVKVESAYVDILVGQYWSLFGWGPIYQPGTVQIQGIPGEIYARNPQIRLSHTFKSDAVSLDLAVAAFRPVQRDSGTPDGQAGIKFNVDAYKGAQTSGATGSSIVPMSIAVSGLLRHVAVNDFNVPASNTNTKDLTMSAVAVDGFVPIVPARSMKDKDNAFSLQGEFASGYGIADMYTNLNGGVGFPSPTTGSYVPNIDQGIVSFDGAGNLHAIQWTTYNIGAQYTLPGVDGKLLLTGNYTHQESANSHYYTFGASNAAKVLHAEDFFDVDLFYDPVPGVRFGADYANFNDSMVSGLRAINHRVQFSGYFIF